MVAVPPAPTPVTTPPVVTVATPGALLLQVPPGELSVKVMVDPLHKVLGPKMDDVGAVTVIVWVLDVILIGLNEPSAVLVPVSIT